MQQHIMHYPTMQSMNEQLDKSAQAAAGAVAGAAAAVSATAFDVERIREDFPILSTTVNGKPLVYLDNAATTQKPRAVIEVLDEYYSTINANVHRGVHYLSQRATDRFEAARSRVRAFINAEHDREIIFVRGATEAINLVAQSYGRTFIKEGDEIIISAMEHHSNIVPWQMLCQQTGAVLKVIPIDDRGDIILEEYQKLLSDRTKLVAVVHLSNALGTLNPVKQIIDLAHQREIPVLLDGAQAVSHLSVDVRDLDADFYVFSGHKAFGPTGIGILYGKEKYLDAMPPWQGGGEMILSVSFERTIYNELPAKFEAGTPNIAGAIGMGTAIEYMESIGLDAIANYEHQLLDYAHSALESIDGLRLIGTARQKASILSFVLDSAHPHDIGTIIDGHGVAIRTGHHCAEPVMEFFGVPATARASLAFYNTREEIDALVRGIESVKQMFS
jgi:cysteine desulfurase/selenocysteine lyase